MAGNPFAQDMALVFADLRFLEGCPAEIRDIPDFAAHRPNKDRGITFDHSNLLFDGLEDIFSGRRTSNWTSQAIYSDVSVVDALKSFFIVKAIFQPSELIDTSNLIRPVALYTLSTLHGCKLNSSGRAMATLAIRLGHKGTLELGCTAPLTPGMKYRNLFVADVGDISGTSIKPITTISKPENIRINLCIFSTSLGPDATIGRLKEDLEPWGDEDTTIEVTPDGFLQYLE
jgi:hypothetical protein